MKTKALIITLPIVIIISLIGGYFVYMDYSDRQREKEIKRLIVKMQGEIEQAAYTAKSKNTARIALKAGDVRRKKAVDVAYKLREYSFDVYSKKHGPDFLIGYDGIKHVEFIFKQIDPRYKIREYAKLDKKNIKLIFPQRAFKKFMAELLAEAQKERKAVIKEAKYEIRELEKENASLAKIEAIKDKYKKIVQKLETE